MFLKCFWNCLLFWKSRDLFNFSKGLQLAIWLKVKSILRSKKKIKTLYYKTLRRWIGWPNVWKYSWNTNEIWNIGKHWHVKSDNKFQMTWSKKVLSSGSSSSKKMTTKSFSLSIKTSKTGPETYNWKKYAKRLNFYIT